MLEVEATEQRDVQARSAAMASLHRRIYRCRRCNEAGYYAEHAPVMRGPVDAPMLLVGQAPANVAGTPGGRPFAGAAGRRLFAWLAEIGWEEEAFRQRCYMTAVTKCYPGPGPNGKGDRAPSRQEQKLCRPFIIEELALLRPAVVIPVGRLAIEFFLGRVGPLDQVVGRAYRLDDDGPLPGTQAVPLPHPSGANLWLNKEANRALVQQALACLQRLTHPFLDSSNPI